MRHAETGPGTARIRWSELPGDEPARVYLHGLGNASGASFAHVAAHPLLAGRRQLLLDLFGFGLSDRPADFGYGIADHADAVAAALDSAGVTGAEVVGHSMGGSVAVVLAARRPDLVSRLVVAEATLDPAVERGRIGRHTEDGFVSGGHEDVLAAVDSEWRATMRLAGRVGLYRSAAGFWAESFPPVREMLLRMDIPRTFVRGERGEPLDGAEELRAAGVRLDVVRNAGHTMMFDNPDGFIHAVATGLAHD
ncbi:alpha/beta hydrolase [Solihabitans fulvus]|uniref:Alpha/beta hydrolase n=1 Tax=Solihabitans fulvus TaxID=1892852 RepID=A0A5B2WPV4_9PSEU|nr:alpha/beta hydrolase [Solihabitans fulvus]KAA2252556.1 alpha/beta hydrolase [Solihabitans fulvus]